MDNPPRLPSVGGRHGGATPTAISFPHSATSIVALISGANYADRGHPAAHLPTG